MPELDRDTKLLIKEIEIVRDAQEDHVADERSCRVYVHVLDEAILKIELLTAEVAEVRSGSIYPRLSREGDQWCALYGENLQEGVAGFGDTPAEAWLAFKKAWAGKQAGV